jgi:hypothetical protein
VRTARAACSGTVLRIGNAAWLERFERFLSRDPEPRERPDLRVGAFEERLGVELDDGARRLLLKLLKVKFGELSEETRGRVRPATDVELDTWTARVLTAGTLDEVFD